MFVYQGADGDGEGERWQDETLADAPAPLHGAAEAAEGGDLPRQLQPPSPTLAHRLQGMNRLSSSSAYILSIKIYRPIYDVYTNFHLLLGSFYC